MSRPFVLMTTHGTLLCHGPEGLHHVALSDLSDADTPVMLDLQAVTRDDRHVRMLTKTNTSLVLDGFADLPPGCEVVLGPDRRTAALRADGKYFCTEPLNRMLSHDRDTVGLWESFLFLSEEDFAGIKHVFCNDWVQRSTRTVVRKDRISLREGFLLVLGELQLDLRYNLPFQIHTGSGPDDALCFTVLVDGWKIDRIHLYRPFVYFTAFGSPYALEQAYTAIGSLVEFGGYDGHVHVITDQDAAGFHEHVLALPADRLTTQYLAASDWVGFVASKYSILEHEPAYSFQPLMFLDTDVVCDAPLEPMLATIVALDRMSAPLEDVSSLQTNPSVGGSLVQRSGQEARFSCGLNGGSVGIPNLRSCAGLMELTRAVITNHGDLFGRDHFRWVDQEVLNYVSFCVGHFDTSALLRFIRYGWKGDEFDGTRRLGLVHFWPPVENRPKLDRMRDYILTLRADQRGF